MFNQQALDVLSLRNRINNQSAFTEGEAFFEPGLFHVRFLSGRMAQVDLVMSESWIQEGINSIVT